MQCREDRDGVKKYRVSYISGAALRAGLVFMLLCMGFFVTDVILEKIELGWEGAIILAVGFLGIILIVIGMFTSISTYKFSISYTGITMYEPKHVYKFSWDEFVDYGIAVLDVSSRTSRTLSGYTLRRDVSENPRNVILCESSGRSMTT